MLDLLYRKQNKRHPIAEEEAFFLKAFKKPGKLFLKTSKRNNKKACLREFSCVDEQMWSYQIMTFKLVRIVQNLVLPYIMYFYIFMHSFQNIAVDFCTLLNVSTLYTLKLL